MDTSTRLRLATRIHFALLRHYGQKVEIGELMKAEGEVREAIWVCEASGDAELATIARQLREASDAPEVPGRVPQDTAWASETSGFGVSRPVACNFQNFLRRASDWRTTATNSSGSSSIELPANGSTVQSAAARRADRIVRELESGRP